ncbi:hypothetical protein A0H81_06794 [Grifola frondosa]|uniref:Uncharacterized protein n=1 Tax=Grifola frondosa TaxID=5627 RepID=A0A1C7M9F7_GRIFR|nr:hypothetical protein A0H81_06794 [Grifola frondosa]
MLSGVFEHRFDIHSGRVDSTQDESLVPSSSRIRNTSISKLVQVAGSSRQFQRNKSNPRALCDLRFKSLFNIRCYPESQTPTRRHYAAYLLAHLSPSPHARIEISINLASDAQDNEDYKSLETFTAALPRQWPMMPIFSAAQTLTLLFLDTKVKLRATTDGGPSLTICQDYEWADFLDVVGNIPLAVDNSRGCFLDAPCAPWTYTVYQAMDRWVTKWSVSGMESWLAFQRSRTYGDGVVCPHLQSITVEAECFGDDPTFEAVLSMLEYRAARGSRLQKLRLTSQSDDLAKSTIQTKFAHLVDDFDYDYVERPREPKDRKILISALHMNSSSVYYMMQTNTISYYTVARFEPDHSI